MQDAQSFLAHVLPPDGPYVLAYATKTRKGMTHKIFETTETMAREALKISKSGAEVYLCVGSILDKEFTNDKGKKVPRNQRNIKSLQCLILDIDVVEPTSKKADRFFTSKQEALESLVGFVNDLGVPKPTIVDSGGGFHAWFGMSPSLDRFDWFKLASKLKAAILHYNPKLLADSTRVLDSASLLRIVGTNNYKTDIIRPVKQLNTGKLSRPLDYEEKLNRYLTDRNIDIPNELIEVPKHIIKTRKMGVPIPAHERSHPDILPSGIPSNPKPAKNAGPAKSAEPATLSVGVDISIDDEPHNFIDVIRKCNWTREYIRNQATEPEPNWYAMLGMMPYLAAKGMDGNALAHVISEKHPTYTKAGTDRKFEQAKNSQRGPTTCARFRALDHHRCDECPFAKSITTPIRLDTIDVPADAPKITQEIITAEGIVKTETITKPKPPYPYFRGKNGGGIFMQIGDGEDSETKRIYEYDMFPVRRLKDEETDSEQLEISLTLPQAGHRFIKVSNALLTDPKRLSSALAEKGVLVHPREAPQVYRLYHRVRA